MNVNNFIVRPKCKLVEKYADAKAWVSLGTDEKIELVNGVAGLPSELVDDDQEAKPIRSAYVAAAARPPAAREVLRAVG